jgi:amidase
VNSAREAVSAAIDRINQINPLINAICTVAADAMDRAHDLDVETAAGHSRGPLHGVPILLKDNIDTASMLTTAGSLALAGQAPAKDAQIVSRLLDAGMVVMGKTNLSEWANIRDPSSTSGWSAFGGLTRNPYGLNRSAGGSSAGSGAAVAAGLTSLAIGTETDGSITCPAAFNGCVGIKPTVGLLPTEGIVPVSWSQDAPGPMATSVRGAAMLLDVLAANGRNYFSHAVGGALAGKRIGIPRRPFWGYSVAADTVAEQALTQLSREGAELVDNTDLESMVDWESEEELQVLLSELKVGLDKYLASRSGHVPRSLAEVVEFNRRHGDIELKYFGQRYFEKALELPGIDSPEYASARAECLRRARDEGTERLLRENALDALVAPSYTPAIPIDLVNEEHFAGSCTTPSAIAGYPIVTVPAGIALGLPVAVSFWGGASSESTLIEIAHGFESARNGRDGQLPAPNYPTFI